MTPSLSVLKLGGAAGVEHDAFLDGLAEAWRRGESFVLVHGGSDLTNTLSERLGIAPRFLTSPSGHVSRRTDAETLDVFLMATALLNRRLVAGLQARGVDAVGLCGLDGRVLEGERKDAIRAVEDGRVRIVRDDWTGAPRRCRAEFLGRLLAARHLPVLAPVALSPRGEPLNVDGDRAAACVAAALAAKGLVFFTNVPGLLRDPTDPATLVERLDRAGLEAALLRTEGRMKKKLLAAREALEQGVPRVAIAAGQGADALARACAGACTVIEAAGPRSRSEAPGASGEAGR